MTLLEQDLLYRLIPVSLSFYGERNLNPVDELWPCDQSVINSLVVLGSFCSLYKAKKKKKKVFLHVFIPQLNYFIISL